MKKTWIVGGFVVASAFGMSAPVMADDRDDHHAKRYYDRDRRDYHSYNDQEDRAFRIYMNFGARTRAAVSCALASARCSRAIFVFAAPTVGPSPTGSLVTASSKRVSASV